MNIDLKKPFRKQRHLQKISSPPNKFYQSITELPLSRFIDCQVDNNLNALVVSGSPSIDDLSEAWLNISYEYTDAVGDMEYKVYLHKIKEVKLFEIDLCLIYNCIAVLELVHIQCYADKINKILRTSFAFDPSNPKKYQEELKRSINRSKGTNMLVEVKKAELTAMEQRFKDKSKKPTRGYFQSLLNILSDHAKYEIHDTITVYRFCDRLRRCNDYCNKMENNNTK